MDLKPASREFIFQNPCCRDWIRERRFQLLCLPPTRLGLPSTPLATLMTECVCSIENYTGILNSSVPLRRECRAAWGICLLGWLVCSGRPASSAWAERPVEATHTVHVLTILGLLLLPHGPDVVSLDVRVLGGAEPPKAHHGRHVHIRLHIHIAIVGSVFLLVAIVAHGFVVVMARGAREPLSVQSAVLNPVFACMRVTVALAHPEREWCRSGVGLRPCGKRRFALSRVGRARGAAVALGAISTRRAWILVVTVPWPRPIPVVSTRSFGIGLAIAIPPITVAVPGPVASTWVVRARVAVALGASVSVSAFTRPFAPVPPR